MTEARARQIEKERSETATLIANFTARGLEPGRPDGEWFRRVIPGLRRMLEALERLGAGDPGAEREVARLSAELQEYT